MENKADFRLANFTLRTEQYFPNQHVCLGYGNSLSNVMTVQSSSKMVERDAVSGALKHVGLLGDTFRTSDEIVRGADAQTNYKLFRELVDLVKPRFIIACGEDAMSFVRNKEVQRWSRHVGRKFKADNLPPQITCLAATNPFDYGFATAPQRLKDQGRSEWNNFETIISKSLADEFGDLGIDEIYAQKGCRYGWV